MPSWKSTLIMDDVVPLNLIQHIIDERRLDQSEQKLFSTFTI